MESHIIHSRLWHLSLSIMFWNLSTWFLIALFFSYGKTAIYPFYCSQILVLQIMPLWTSHTHMYTFLLSIDLGAALPCNSGCITIPYNICQSFSNYSSRYPCILQYYLIFNKTSVLKEHTVLFPSPPEWNL